MNRNRFNYIWLYVSILCGLCLYSCDVHEFPYPVEIEYTLHLDYNTELPLHKVVEYYEDDTKSSTKSSDYDIRYIIEATSVSGEYEPQRFVFSKDDTEELNNKFTLKLMEGEYNFKVWTDYILSGNNDDLFYNTSRFEDICITDGEYRGSIDLKDAFKGSVTSTLSVENTSDTVNMMRPLAKFNFISTDIDKFISKVAELMPTNDGETKIDLNDYTIVFAYQGFVPSSFNLNTDKPADSKTNIAFKSKINALNNNEAELGFDYVFVHDYESYVTVAIGVYDNEGNLMSQFKPVEVPLMRSKLTTVKGNFLTAETGGSVGILPDFEGDFNIEIK